jgi:hypothetical protein
VTTTFGELDGSQEAILAELLSKQEITEVLYLRARAGDRKDVELALRCYHDGATEEHEGYKGTAADFILNESMISPNSTKPVSCLWHFISNIMIQLDGDDAQVESYHLAVIERDDDGGSLVRIGGRYLDQFSYRYERWAISHRSVVFDWSRVDALTMPYWDLMGLDESKLLRGSFGPNDPLYTLFGLSRG